MQIVFKDDSYKSLLTRSMDFSKLHSLLYEIVSSVIEEKLRELGTVVHSVCHWLMYHLIRRKERIICNNVHAIIASLKFYPCISPQHKIFLDISQKLRKINLLRPHSRGSDDDFNLIIVRTSK